MDVLDAIQTKRAVRSFKPQPIPEPIIESILHAGRRAQSAKNRQPWHFLAVRGVATLKKLASLGMYAGHISGASLAIVILTPDPAGRWSIMFDAGQAAAYMQLAAWQHGIGSCLATIYELEAARDLLKVPDHLHPQVAISFGYPEDPALLTKPPQAGGRLPFDEVVHFEQWQGE